MPARGRWGATPKFVAERTPLCWSSCICPSSRPRLCVPSGELSPAHSLSASRARRGLADLRGAMAHGFPRLGSLGIAATVALDSWCCRGSPSSLTSSARSQPALAARILSRDRLSDRPSSMLPAWRRWQARLAAGASQGRPDWLTVAADRTRSLAPSCRPHHILDQQRRALCSSSATARRAPAVAPCWISARGPCAGMRTSCCGLSPGQARA